MHAVDPKLACDILSGAAQVLQSSFHSLAPAEHSCPYNALTPVRHPCLLIAHTQLLVQLMQVHSQPDTVAAAGRGEVHYPAPTIEHVLFMAQAITLVIRATLDAHLSCLAYAAQLQNAGAGSADSTVGSNVSGGSSGEGVRAPAGDASAVSATCPPIQIDVLKHGIQVVNAGGASPAQSAPSTEGFSPQLTLGVIELAAALTTGWQLLGLLGITDPVSTLQLLVPPSGRVMSDAEEQDKQTEQLQHLLQSLLHSLAAVQAQGVPRGTVEPTPAEWLLAMRQQSVLRGAFKVRHNRSCLQTSQHMTTDHTMMWGLHST